MINTKGGGKIVSSQILLAVYLLIKLPNPGSNLQHFSDMRQIIY